MKAAALFREQDQLRREFTERYGHARPPMSIKMDGRRMVVVGGSILQQTYEGTTTFQP
jgi:hypothetical protein